jgi:hypothetical protein
VYSKSSVIGQGSSLTAYSHPYQSALCTQSHRSSVKGHNLRAIHVHPSQHYVLKVITLWSRVITYSLTTSIRISSIHSKSSLFGQGSSRTHYPHSSQSALCTQSHRSSVKGHHVRTIHVHPGQHYVLKSSLFGQGSSLTSYSHPSRSVLCTQNHRLSVKGHHLLSIHVQLNQHYVLKVIALRSRVITYILSTSTPVSI